MELLNHASLDYWPLVLTIAAYEIIHRPKDHSRSIQQAGPIHGLRGRIHGCGPKREKHGDHSPNQGKYVGRNAPFAEFPWPVVDVFTAAQTYPEDETDGCDVGA